MPNGQEFRNLISTLALVGVTGALLALGYGILKPFVPVISWALALAAVFYPAHRRIASRFKRDDVAAALSVLFIAVCILLPAIFVGRQLVVEGAASVQAFAEKMNDGTLEKMLSERSRIRLAQLSDFLHLKEGLSELAAGAGNYTASVFSGSIISVVQLLLVLFTCFFFLRDRAQILRGVRGLVPLAPRESEEVFALVDDTIHAILYGTIVVAMVQGALGAVIFWWLELSSPILWGTIMALLAILPYFGAFIVWGPVAAYLALQGNWSDAALLSLWGAIVIGLIDNLLYPFLVGKRLRFHTLLVFFFILGGISFYGAAGIVLGPVTLAVLNAMREIWRRRLVAGRADPAPA